MKLKYIEHFKSEKYKLTHSLIRSFAQENLHEIEVTNAAFGSVGNEIEEFSNGMQNRINSYPRINTGYLSGYFKLVREKNSVKIFDTTKQNRLICEVVAEKGGEG